MTDRKRPHDETVSVAVLRGDIALTLVGVRVGGVRLTADEAMDLARIVVTGLGSLKNLIAKKEGTSS